MNSTIDERQLDRITHAFSLLVRGPRLLRLHQVMNQRAGIEVDRAAFTALATLNDFGPARISDLADSCSVDISTMSRLIGRLTADGLVEQAQFPEDRRVVIVRLADAGTALVQRLRSARRAAMAEVMAEWSASERALFADLLERFSTGIDQLSETAAPACGPAGSAHPETRTDERT